MCPFGILEKARRRRVRRGGCVAVERLLTLACQREIGGLEGVDGLLIEDGRRLGRRDGLAVGPYGNGRGLASLRCRQRRLAQQKVVTRPRCHPSCGQKVLQRPWGRYEARRRRRGIRGRRWGRWFIRGCGRRAGDRSGSGQYARRQSGGDMVLDCHTQNTFVTP
jgi:hypothetical protein